MLSNSIAPWDLILPCGSQDSWAIDLFADADQTIPYDITGLSWEYAVRADVTDTGTPLISLTTTLSAAGQLQITSTANLSRVLINLLPAATATLLVGPPPVEQRTLHHALWSNPGTTSAQCWFAGRFTVQGTSQP